MENKTMAENILSLEKRAMEAWHNGDPSVFLELYSDQVSYFDPSQPVRLDGREKLEKLYEPLRGMVKMDRFEMLNPVVEASGSMAVLTYNLVSYNGTEVWRENCTEVYKLEEDNKWRIIHSHFSPTGSCLE